MPSFLYYLLFLPWITASETADGHIRVKVTDVSKKNGEVMVALFSSPKGFPYETGYAIQKLKGKAVDGVIELTFPAIPEGTYAIALFHDTNGDGQLNTNFMGIPKEGYGVSNNRYNTFSAPDYPACSFRHDKSITDLSIRIKY
jgi:uncharacterized protein (DUF2141 family)